MQAALKPSVSFVAAVAVAVVAVIVAAVVAFVAVDVVVTVAIDVAVVAVVAAPSVIKWEVVVKMVRLVFYG